MLININFTFGVRFIIKECLHFISDDTQELLYYLYILNSISDIYWLETNNLSLVLLGLRAIEQINSDKKNESTMFNLASDCTLHNFKWKVYMPFLIIKIFFV